MAVKTDEDKKQNTYQYQSPYQAELDALAGQIENRGSFRFDVDEDALYNYYRDEYQRQGELARMDTQAQGAALTGGYDNSYARYAGQQAYKGYMDKLGDVSQDIYYQALDKYVQEGEALVDQYTALQKQDEKDRKAWEKEYADEIEAWEDEQAEAEAEEEQAETEAEEAEKETVDPLGFFTQEEINHIAAEWNKTVNTQNKQNDTPEEEEFSTILESNSYETMNYGQAVQRLRTMGAYDHVLQNLMTEDDWNAARAEAEAAMESGEGTINWAVAAYDSYTEYIRAYIAMAERAMANKKPGYSGNYTTSVGAISSSQ